MTTNTLPLEQIKGGWTSFGSQSQQSSSNGSIERNRGDQQRSVYERSSDQVKRYILAVINLADIEPGFRMAVTKASIRGYQASPALEWQRKTPRIYQSRSLHDAQAVSTTFKNESGIVSNQFSDYARAHAFPNVISPSKSRVALSPVSPTSSTSSYYSAVHDGSNTQLSIELECLKPTSLSPSLQSAAARAPPPLSILAAELPRLAPFRPNKASSISFPHLPGPQELIKSTSQDQNVNDGLKRSEFGRTTKIVPLPVTITRPLPLIERKETYKPPVVTLTADQYALRSTVTRVVGSNSYEPRTSEVQAGISTIVFPSGPQASSAPTMNPLDMRPHGGPTPHTLGFSVTPNVTAGVPSGFTSINPAGRSYSGKKITQEFLQTQPLYQPVYQMPPGPISDIPPGFTSQAPVGKSYSEGKRKKTKTTGSELRDEQRHQAELYNNALTRSRPARPPRPTIVPVISNEQNKNRKVGPVKSQYKGIVETQSPAMRSVDREMTMDSMDTLPGNDESYSCDRPAICSFNPVHPLYEERILKGEITTDIICDKRFTRKSDCVRHERIHVNDRPFTCTMEGCNKSFIQRSALTVHIRTHTGEKPHMCDVCTKCFTDSSSLARHRRTHNGVQPYRCSAPHCKQAFSRKFSLSKHFHSTHSDLPVPSQLSFVLRTQRYMSPEPIIPAASMARNIDFDACAVDSGSDLSSAPSSDDTEHEMEPNTATHLTREMADGKVVKLYENDDPKGKYVKVYNPRRESQHTTSQRPTFVTAPPEKKRKYEHTEFVHPISRYEDVAQTQQSGVHADDYVMQATRGAKFSGAVSATRDEIALPLGTIYGPATPASADNYEYPSMSATTRPVKVEAPTAAFRSTGNTNTYKPVYLAMQPSERDGPFYPAPSKLRQTFSNHASSNRPVRDPPRSRIQGYQTDAAPSTNASQHSSAHTTAEIRYQSDSAKNLSQRGLAPFLTDNLDLTSQSERTQHISNFDSAVTMVDSPTEDMMVDEEESKGMNL
ncbi:hypothetical protein QFC22_002255 [Naganishia vaughanmartiniae]|uniref:Uncharacterized protein n=1 Tax=Naganishia vaughanmartiniae TaxID=1424756 RepID=A0ACC2XE31_9TREE|nr:hypothetical protein QFC22_002255 [Naganishia vaughanmartiniae]